MWYRTIIYLMFFLSGSSALIYEIMWNRKLGLIFGSTVYAVTTILTVFFTGLALGAWLIGRAMDRGRNPLFTYAILEILIGVFGICSPFVFLGIEGIYSLIYPFIDTGLFSLTLVRFILSYIGLLLPTTLMGATLPVLVKLVTSSDEKVAFDAGRLYAINTLGAALGTILGTMLLIPLAGVNESLYLAGIINIGIGISAFAIFRSNNAAPAELPVITGYRHTPSQKYVLSLFCIAGLISMVYQVAWIRLLIQVTGNTVYTFGLMLSVFIIGLGLGSEIATRLLSRIRSAILALTLVELAASLYSLLAVRYYDQLPVLFTYLSMGLKSFSGFFIIKIIINVIVLFIPTLMFGAAFPLVTAVYAQKASKSGGDVGSVYALNTVGGVFGSFIGGFIFLPLLGTQTTITVMGLAGLAIAVMLSLMLPGRIQKTAVVVFCGITAVTSLILFRPWDAKLMDSAPYVRLYDDVKSLMAAKNDLPLMYYKEGVNVNVSVIGYIDPTTISINGKPMASTSITDVANQYLLGHLPMLLHPDPRESVVIGLGAGMTFSALARHGHQSDAIEISPEVVGGARLFKKYNRDVLDNPNAHLIFDDGRNYLKTTRKKYDVITEDPLDPFFMGSGYLYDLEHFQNARRALKPGGIMCQYLPLYQVGVEEARIIIKTFHAVFPHVSAWFAFNDMILIGSEEPLVIDVENLKRRISEPGIAQDLKEIGIDNIYDFLANYMFDENKIPDIGKGLPINTDNYPIIEFLTPRTLVRRTEKENVSYFLEKREFNLPKMLKFTSSESSREFEPVLAKYFSARTHLIRSHLKHLNRDKDFFAELKTAADLIYPYPMASYYFADVNYKIGSSMLKGIYYKQGLTYLEKSLSYRPDNPTTLNSYAMGLMRDGRKGEALTYLEKSLNINSRQTLPRIYLADDLVSKKELLKAKDLIQGCVDLDPDNYLCLLNLAELEMMTEKDKKTALDLINRALKVKPDYYPALRFKEQFLSG